MPKTHPADHHKHAAYHHEQAARQHHEASRHHGQGNLRRAAYHAHAAHGHSLHASKFANMASKLHADQESASEEEHDPFEDEMGMPLPGNGHTRYAEAEDFEEEEEGVPSVRAARLAGRARGRRRPHQRQ